METDIPAWAVMALGVGEMFLGIILRQKGLNMTEAKSPRKKYALVRAGTFVAISGAGLAFLGVGMRQFGWLS
jgi:hypothetical protein